MNNPIKILVKKEDITLEGIKQFYVTCNNDASKTENLLEIYGNMNVS